MTRGSLLSSTAIERFPIFVEPPRPRRFTLETLVNGQVVEIQHSDTRLFRGFTALPWSPDDVISYRFTAHNPTDKRVDFSRCSWGSAVRKLERIADR